MLDSPDSEIFVVSSDGVDFKLYEIMHEKFPYDSSACSHKFKSCAAKYLIALSVFNPQCVFISGPFKGGTNDSTMMKESGLLEKLMKIKKLCIVDGGFNFTAQAEKNCLSRPDRMDDSDLHNFKSRARLRQETFNRRLKHFDALSNTFRHKFDKHKAVFEAVVVIVQTQMDNGSPIYCV